MYYVVRSGYDRDFMRFNTKLTQDARTEAKVESSGLSFMSRGSGLQDLVAH